ncbi:MAG: FAD-dependent oxidoreductase [Limnochordaceae bacterium]|nr:FAD-dependent oxidoreductase [Limnochordaceae bacterium]
MAEKFDAIVVGAGPAGITAAYTLAEAGAQVVLIERGEQPGTKNTMGGVLYRKMMDDIIPGFWEQAPLERHVIDQQWWLLSEEAAFSIGHRNLGHDQPPYNAFTVLRAKFDKWYAQQAVKKGALLITETVVTELLKDKQGRVIGIRTDRPEGDLLADVVVVSEGANSLVLEASGLKPMPRSETMAVAVKEVIALPREVIENRFHVSGNQGVVIEAFGNATLGMTGNGFVYTNKDSLSVGVGAMISDFVRRRIHPHQLLEHFKQHPAIAPLVAGGEVKEYLAHMIPEGGYETMPPLYGDGFLVCGDAAGMVIAVHREGSNLAMTSGRLAAQTIVEAKRDRDFSAHSLSRYWEKLNQSYVLQDLRQYRRTTPTIERNPQILGIYPSLLNEVMGQFLTVDGVPKREKEKRLLRLVTRRRPVTGLIKDAWRMGRAML